MAFPFSHHSTLDSVIQESLCFSCEEKSKNIVNFIIPGIQNSALIDKYVFTRLSSEKSFRDAIGKTSVEAGYMIDALDNMHASISNYESGIHNISAETQAFYALLCKRTNDSYTGIIMSYYIYNPIFFAANYKGFILFVPIKVS